MVTRTNLSLSVCWWRLRGIKMTGTQGGGWVEGGGCGGAALALIIKVDQVWRTRRTRRTRRSLNKLPSITDNMPPPPLPPSLTQLPVPLYLLKSENNRYYWSTTAMVLHQYCSNSS